MGVFRALGAVTLVPAVGLGLAGYIHLQQPGAALGDLVSATERCASELPNIATCTSDNLLPALALSSVAALVVGLAIIATYWFIARLCGPNRIVLSLVFPGVTFVTLLAIALLTLSHAGVVTLALFAAQQHWLHQVNDLALIVAAGLGVLAAFGVAGAAIRSYGVATISVIGYPINPLDQPRIMLLVRNIAKKLNTRPPDHVVIGMDANFFVTHANVHMLGIREVLRGRTLFLSVPLMRGLSVGELSATIAHEMAHFANRDAVYSQGFAPIYARLNEAANPSRNRRERNPFFMPVRALTQFLVMAFHSNVARISQIRELAADAAAAKATSPADVANSLVKVSIMAHVWEREIGAVQQRAAQGRFSRNISRNFAEHVRYDLDKDRISDAAASILAWHIPHPTDSHPATEERIRAVGVDPAQLLKKDELQQRFFGQRTAADELDDVTNIEEQLTFIYQKYLEHIGLVRHREMDAAETFRFVLIDFLAHMITADGVVDDREIVVAEREGAILVPAFDSHDLRERCRHPDELMDFDKLIELALKFLNPAGFRKLRTILEKIAAADGMQDVREAALLARVQAASELAVAA